MLYLEDDRPETSESLLSYLQELDYEVWWHLPLFYNPDNFARESSNIHALGYIDIGGPYLQCIGFAINILCVPKARPMTVNDLLKVEDVGEHPSIRESSRFRPS